MSAFKRPGADVYSYDFRCRGRRFSGTTSCTTKREAERFEQTERERIKAAEINLAKPLTFAQASSLYWHEVGQHHRNALTTERVLEWLGDHIGDRTLIADIGDAMVAKLVARRRGEAVSHATVNRTVLEPLCAILRRAKSTWKARVQDIEWRNHFLKEPQERVREASSAEETTLLQAIRSDYEPALRFALLTGCRRAEIVGLEWTSVDFINRAFKVTGKGDKTRHIPMTREVRDLLWSLKDYHRSAVFTYVAQKTRDGRVRGTRYPITDAGFKTAWRRRVEDGDNKIVDFRFHDTRHTAATRLVRATGNLRLAQRLLGHTDIATTTKYAHVTHEDLRAGLEAAATKTATQTPTRKRRAASND